MVSSTCCSYRGPGFKPPNQHGSSYVSVIPVQGDPIASLGTKHACSVHTYKYGGKPLWYTFVWNKSLVPPILALFLLPRTTLLPIIFTISGLHFFFSFPNATCDPAFSSRMLVHWSMRKEAAEAGNRIQTVVVQHRLWEMTLVSPTNIMPGNI